MNNNEDFFATKRNGHLLKDTFNKELNTLDIRSNGLYPANVLSNLAYKPFVFDDVYCSSMEGFLQSLKTKDVQEQRKTCLLYGGSARKKSSKYKNWKTEQKLYWNGKEYDRDSKEYEELLYNAYKKCYEQNDIFKEALSSTKNLTLTHKDGKIDKDSTIITQEEFINILTKLRDDV
ncbi:MAG: hypothetical protein LUH05_07565 [Candidatus Gastranaerophilales bacterium]|nr:hypothetical protein [Candidatus Gastranaerophilales bacterium]